MEPKHRYKWRTHDEIEPCILQNFAEGMPLHMTEAERAEFRAHGYMSSANDFNSAFWRHRIGISPDRRLHYEFEFLQLKPTRESPPPRVWCRLLASRDRSAPVLVAVVWHPDDTSDRT